MREKLSKDEIREHAADSHNTNPAVYCGTYHKYNCCSLYGMWIDLTTFDYYEDFIEFCYRLHADEEDPELMFQDYEHFPESWYSEGYLSEDTFYRIKEYADLDEDKREAYEVYLDNYDDKGNIEDFEERYCGHWDCPEDFAEEIVDECGDLQNVPDWLRGCIDWSAVWRNLETGGDYTEYDGHIFRNY